jgi:DNA-binding XRE family transcriptional regulator
MKRTYREEDLAALAKRFRVKAGIKRAQAARDLKVSQTSIFHAEEVFEQALTKLRIEMIERYSPYRVVGPAFFLKEKRIRRTAV